MDLKDYRWWRLVPLDMLLRSGRMSFFHDVVTTEGSGDDLANVSVPMIQSSKVGADGWF
jgi:hypothetical protein